MINIEDKYGNEKAITELIEAVMRFAFRPEYEGALKWM